MGRTGSKSVWASVRLALMCLVANGGIGPAWADSVSGPRVILISLDGTRPVDVQEDSLPSLVALADRGAWAERLVPVVPTNTFPNHVTLVTGVSPGRHGVVNNTFFDPDRGFFDRSRAEEWIEVEPLWSWVERRGVRSASYHWVGSEGPWRDGRAASDWVEFSSRTPELAKVDKILEWLDRPDPAERPRLITSWFHGADHRGHIDGPGSESVGRALRKQDAAIGRLIQGLEERKLFGTTTLIFVSDHGMALAPRRVDLESALNEGGVEARVLGSGGFATVIRWGKSRGDPSALVRIVEIARGLGLEAATREALSDTHGFSNPRFGEVIVRARPGTAIASATLQLEGFHGYDPSEPSMEAIFIAAGRGVSAGTRLSVVSAVDVAPTVLALLSQEVPEWMEGKPIEAIVPEAEASANMREPGRPKVPGRGR